MLRVSSSRCLLGVALFLTVANPPLSLSAQTEPRLATVQQVLTREDGGAIEVEIQTSGGPVSPNTQAIIGPDRIVIDFPGALPSAALRALKVNHGALKGVRSGLFFSDPPITRIVLDLTRPQSYKISTSDRATVVKLSAGAGEPSASAPAHPLVQSGRQSWQQSAQQGPRLRDTVMAGRPAAIAAHVSPASAVSDSAHLAASPQSMEPQQPASTAETIVPSEPKPTVSVTYENGMLRILADKATLSQVLYEVQLRTQAEIAIPAGAEQEKVVANLGPAPARVVLGELLNGSAYNFIFVGDELALQRVILTRRAGSF